MHDETPRRRIQKLREELSRNLRQSRVRLGESLLRSRGIELSATDLERERIAQIEAYKDLIRSMTRDLEEWREFSDRATSRGMFKQAQFRERMIAAMEIQLECYKEELRRLQSIPGSFWAGST
jgi:hypothetical protein